MSRSQVVAAFLGCTLLASFLSARSDPKTVDTTKENLRPENLARGKKAVASSNENGDKSAEMAVDGNPETRWCASGPKLHEWWQVDLGRAEDLTGCQIAWEHEGLYAYEITSSLDGVKWTRVCDQSKAQVKANIHLLKFSIKARYLKVTVIGLPDGSWPSFFEFEAHGTKEVRAESQPKPDRSAELLKTVKAPDGFEVTLFAAPPDISYPTCLCTTPDGSLFVGVDKNGSLGAKTKRGEVVRCFDTKGTGKADKFQVFTAVDSPRGLWWDGRKTLYVLHPPFLSAFHDDNGDGVADRHEQLVEGLGMDLTRRGADHTTNGFRLGIDGWFYIAVGDYGALRAKGADGKLVTLHGGGVMRVRPDGSGLEIVADGERNIYDVAISSTMDLFTRDNTNDGDGWDVRLAHVVPTGHYGYPSLYRNFGDEFLQPLLDTGGGSPTGAIFLDEPGWHGLYTCEWGRSSVDHHPLTLNGASWKATKESFLSIPRPTDLDIDAQGHLYVASWKDGGFDFSNPNVGFVARLTPKTLKSKPFPDVTQATDEELLGILGSPSQFRRLYAQRELLHRGKKPGVIKAIMKLATDGESIAVKAAAIFTLIQFQANEALVQLAARDDLREFVLRASDSLPLPLIVASLKDANPRVRLQALIGLNRLGKIETAAAILPLTGDQDPVVSHIAINALIALKASEVCFKALDGDNPAIVVGALRALQAMHETAVVDGLIARLSSANNSALRPGLVRTLARLYQREAEWDGKWWGTRPDTTGPYFKPETWRESEKIAITLKNILSSSDRTSLRIYLPDLLKNRVEFPEMTPILISLAGEDAAMRRLAVRTFSQRSTPPVEAIPFIATVATDTQEEKSLRTAALKALIRQSNLPSARDAAITALTASAKSPSEFEPIWAEFVRDGKRLGEIAAFIAMADDQSEVKRELAYGVLATIADRNLGSKEARASAEAAIAQAWAKPTATLPLVRAIGRLNLTSYAPQIRKLSESQDTELARAARSTLNSLKIDKTTIASNLPTIGKLKYEDIVAQIGREKGNAALGEKMFQRIGCTNCHASSAGEVQKGPLLAGITARYNRTELTEAILKPSAKIAQGFETHKFSLSNGKQLTAFIVRESGTEVEVRDATGATTLLKKSDIEERSTSSISVMPEKLVDDLTVIELASIMAYLESLKAK